MHSVWTFGRPRKVPSPKHRWAWGQVCVLYVPGFVQGHTPSWTVLTAHRGKPGPLAHFRKSPEQPPAALKLKLPLQSCTQNSLGGKSPTLLFCWVCDLRFFSFLKPPTSVSFHQSRLPPGLFSWFSSFRRLTSTKEMFDFFLVYMRGFFSNCKDFSPCPRASERKTPEGSAPTLWVLLHV